MNKIVNLLAILEVMGGKNLQEIGQVFASKLKVISDELTQIEKEITGKE